MSSCKLPNYLESKYSELSLNLSKTDNLDSLIKNILDELEKQNSFSIHPENSLNRDEYNDSITNLVDKIIKDIEDKKLYTGSDTSELKEKLINKLTEFKYTETDQVIMAVIPDAGLITEAERLDIKFNDLVSDIVGTSSGCVFNSMQRLFKLLMKIATIIGETSLVTNDAEINSNIQNFLEKLYNIIKLFLNEKYPNKFNKLINGDLYINDDINPTVYNTLQIIYNYINSLKQKDIFETELNKAWEDYVLNKQSNLISLYQVVNAYISLAYFDDFLKLSLGGYISINRKMDCPIVIGSDNVPKYKYKITRGNINAVKTWGVETRDSLKEMSKFSQVLIESIKLYDYLTKREEYGYMEVKDFINTMSYLFDLIPKLLSVPNLQKALIDFKSSPSKINEIFKEIFENDAIDTLRRNGFDLNYINYLYSIYETVFNGKNSWSKIESRYKKINLIPSTYSIIDTILAVMNSNTSANYLQTSFNNTTKNSETTIKTKYNIKSGKFKVVNSVNDIYNNSKSWRDRIKDLYKLTGTNSFTLSIGDILILIRPKGDSNILLKSPKAITNINISINGNPLTNFISDISTKDIRNEIFNGSRTQDQENLMQVLQFIDNMLNTSFSRSEQGLQSFYLMQKLNKNNFHEMLATAVKALLINNIYTGFDDAKTYKKNELIKFLKEHGTDYLNVNWEILSTTEGYFRPVELLGQLLYVLNGGEDWLLDYSKVMAILNGDTSASTISNFEGKKYPNYTPSFLGNSIFPQLAEFKKSGGASSRLLFAQHPNFITESVINQEVRTQYGIKKLISSMNIGELLYDSIVNKFIIPYFSGKVYTQASAYADKSKIITYGINLKDVFDNGILDNNFEENVQGKIIDTIGAMYKELWNTVQSDYIKLIRFLNIQNISITTQTDAFRNTITTIDKVALNNWLKTISEKELLGFVEQYNNKNPNDKLSFITELHYRVYNGKCTLNELLQEYITNIYNSTDVLNKVLYRKKIDFANDLLKYRVKIKYDKENKSDPIHRFINLVLGSHVNDWLSGTTLAVGRITNSNGESRLVSYGQIKLNEGETFELNPVINLYFLIDNYLGNNLRYCLTATETNHKIKELGKLNLNKSFLMHSNRLKKLIGEYDSLTVFDIKNAINKMKRLTKEDKQIIALYNNLIYHLSNLALNALFKRNVPIPGTIRPYLQKCINGMASKMNIAVMKDIPASVFNFNGKTDVIDAHDGSAWINPIASILENWSLLDSEVGTIKKPLHHYVDPKTGTAVLLKYAVDTMTNQWMRQAEGNTNGIILLKLLKKMLGNKRWNGTINLINSCQFRKSSKIDFGLDILNNELLYYYDGINHIQILDFGLENNIYYTLERKVDVFGATQGEDLKVYHYFKNGTSEHITSDKMLDNPEYHTIDSLYELHTTLGGIYCESLIDNKLQYSEASNYAVARFCNYVALKKEGTDKNSPVDQDYYYQPLKEMMIHMIANQSAVKNGAANINFKDRFINDEELSYFTVGTEYYGIQLDADHEADEAVLTEFSQVISSLDVDGQMHDYVNEVYQALGQLSLELSEIELSGIELFQEDGDKTHLYEILGRTIIENLRKDTPGLTKTIIEKINKEFNLKSNHIFDNFKIPFSDSNIYSLILPTFISIINNKSIKRKYPGSGIVMAPGYNLSMIYEIDGKPYLYLDILRRALSLIPENTNLPSDIYSRNRFLVQSYLANLLKELKEITISEIVPTDNIYVVYIDLSNNEIPIHKSLYSIEDYYKYTDARFNLFGLDESIESKIIGNTLTLKRITENIEEEVSMKYEDGKYYISNSSSSDLAKFLYKCLPQGLSFTLTDELKKLFTGFDNTKQYGRIKLYKDVTVPRNLAPLKIFYKLNGDKTNIYLHWKIKRLFLEKAKDEETLRQWRKEAQDAFLEIKNGKYIDEFGAELKVSDVEILAAELIVSNIYKSKFGLDTNESLANLLEDKSRFILSGNKRDSTIFDVCFTGNKDTYISFTNLYGNTNCKLTHLRQILVPYNDQNVVERIYEVNSDNVRLFEIGRVIKTEGVTYEKDSDGVYRFYTKNEQNEKIKAKGTYKIGENGEVLEIVQFLTKYRVKEKGKSSIGYCINRHALKRVLIQKLYSENELKVTNSNGETIILTKELKFESEVNNFISKLLGDIYKNGEHNGVLINSNISTTSRDFLRNCWNRFANQLNYNKKLYDYLKDLYPIIDSDKKIKGIDLLRKLRKYNTLMSEERFASFQKSLNYIASRIPAQTLQSFMQMRCVGFTGVPNAQCYVSHWQTWLQGSDYKPVQS